MRQLRAADVGDAAPLRLRGPGRRTSDTRASIYIRNAMLVEAAALFCGSTSSNAAAQALHRQLARYHEGAWRRHRSEEHLPAGLVGKVTEIFWHALKARDAVPAARSIRLALDAAKKRWPGGTFLANRARYVDGRSNARGR
ncbi:hypothetical protein [Bradyrhizobium sp. WSM1417]|uniref:hypothetical protein n=1 Tax=Bradyrhizobium sp. WSM1417 TaxID=754500 RepID=UPI0004801BF1|nr:hypothetical protein [Bradyrhizobium sp. WSM1417]